MAYILMGCQHSDVRPPAISIRIALVGRKGSGKSALLSAFLRKSYDCTPTVFSQIGVKTYSFNDSGVVTTLEVWEVSQGLVARGFSIVLLLLDAGLSARDMSEEIAICVNSLRTQGRLGVLSVVVTKSDTVTETAESLKQRVLDSCGHAISPQIFITSAKSQRGIEEMFRTFARPIVLSRSVSRLTSLGD